MTSFSWVQKWNVAFVLKNKTPKYISEQNKKDFKFELKMFSLCTSQVRLYVKTLHNSKEMEAI